MKIFAEEKIGEKRACQFYDFTAFKISDMIYELLDDYIDHPDLDALSMILSMYMSGDVDIIWKEGYPMPYLKEEKFFDDDYGLE
jgi:hypothetical protein